MANKAWTSAYYSRDEILTNLRDTALDLISTITMTWENASDDEKVHNINGIFLLLTEVEEALAEAKTNAAGT